MTTTIETDGAPFISRKVLLGYSARVELRPDQEGEKEARGYLMSPLEIGMPVLLLTDAASPLMLAAPVSAVSTADGQALVLDDNSRWVVRGGARFTPGFEDALKYLRSIHPGYKRDIEGALGLRVPDPAAITAMEVWHSKVFSERMNINDGDSCSMQTSAPPDIRGKSPFQAFGYSVGPGWLPIVSDLFRRVRQITDLFRVEQVKEKFGRLRMYASGGTTNEEKEQIRNLILCAELSSSQFCESCGLSGSMRSDGGWWRTACDACDHRHQRRNLTGEF